jgi:NitT/TauT family transport system substrate-binding protein
MANHQGDIGYIGWVPAIIARTQGIPVVTVSASDVEATSVADNWQNVLVKGDGPVKTPADLVGKTVAVNALKGVGEVVIRAALDKLGVDQTKVKFVAIPFPAMRAALNAGQVDAFFAPEPFLTQGLTLDGDRSVLAPGPTLGKYWPNGTYVALQDWVAKNPALAKGFHDAMAESLAYAQAHPEAVRAMLPAAIRNIRLPVWSSLIDRRQLLLLAQYTKKFGVITTLPNMAALVPASIATGLTLQGTVTGNSIGLKLDGKQFKSLRLGSYTFVVSDRSARQNFHLKGPGLNKSTGTRQVGRLSFTTKLAKGRYTYASDANPSLRGSFTVA